MTITQYEISVVRYDDFGTDASVRIDLLQLSTADRAVVAMNLRMMADAIAGESNAPVEPAGPPTHTRKRRRDAGVPRGSAPTEGSEMQPESLPPASPFSVTS